MEATIELPQLSDFTGAFSLEPHISPNARMTLDEVDAIETPAGDEKYTPLPHGKAFRLVRKALNDVGMHVIGEHHAIARNGQRYMGLMPIMPQKPGQFYNTYFPVVGVRNSHDKQFAFELLIAAVVQGVENLFFTSKEAIGMRRHVNLTDARLYDSISDAVLSLPMGFHRQERRFKFYRKAGIDGIKEAHHYIFELFKAGHIPATSMPDVEEAWTGPIHSSIDHFGDSVWKLLNCVLYARRKKYVFLQPERNAKLAAFLDDVANYDPELFDTEAA